MSANACCVILFHCYTYAINWDLVKRQYNEMVKYATALRVNTGDTEAILKQFSKNSCHPTFLAFQELGKVIKTMFLCDYLASEQLRKEIHSGLNTIESWHSASNFIFYGQGGEIRRNELEEQEVTMLSLQLIQNCIINQRFIFRMLKKLFPPGRCWFSP